MKLFKAANQFCKESTWKTISILKLCLLALGIAIGMYIPDGAKNVVLAVCAVVFLATCIPLVKKLVGILRR